MKEYRIRILLASLIVIILFLHIGGLYLHLYWRFPVYDKVVHILASFWFALTTLYLFARNGLIYTKKTNILIIGICATLIIGLVWEFFEYYVGHTSVLDAEFLEDTIGDIILDILGSFVGSLYALTLFTLWNHKKQL